MRFLPFSLLIVFYFACFEVAHAGPKSAEDDFPRVIESFEVGENVVVRALTIEPKNNALWVGTSVGVHEIDITTHKLRNTFNRDNGLANEYVFAIGVDREGYKWFGTNAGPCWIISRLICILR